MKRKHDRPHLSIILPTYNERGNIIRLIESIRRICAKTRVAYEIIHIDDNSSDTTGKISQKKYKGKHEVRVFIRKKERGLASAIALGIKKSKGNLVLVMDTDFNHDPKMIPEFLKESLTIDFIIGSRFVDGGGMENFFRQELSRYFNIYLKLLLGHKINDNLSGFFLIRKKLLRELNSSAIFYGFGDYFMRLILALVKKDVGMKEIPVYYRNRTFDTSKSRFLPMFFSYTKSALQLRFDRQHKTQDFLTRLWTHAPFSWAIIRANECRLLEQIKFTRPIMEVGCGDGFVTSVLFRGKKGAVDVGIDINNDEIRRAQKTGVYRKLVCINIADTSFNDCSFATIFANGVLEHIPKLSEGLTEISRLLKRGGHLITTSPTENFTHLLFYYRLFMWLGMKRVAKKYGDYLNEAFAHHHLWSKPKWEKELNKVGLRLVKYNYYNNKFTVATHDLFLPFALPSKIIKKHTNKMVFAPFIRRIFFAPLILYLDKKLNNETSSQYCNGSILLIAEKT